MILNEQAIITFAESVPARCRSERDSIIGIAQGTWDTIIRKALAGHLCIWFCQEFNLTESESKSYLFVEGWNPIPGNLRGRAFFGTKMHPDVAIILGEKPIVSIELDHGAKGSQIRNALAKASFSVILGGYIRAMLLFFVEQPKDVLDFQKQDGEEVILKLFKDNFRTTLHLI